MNRDGNPEWASTGAPRAVLGNGDGTFGEGVAFSDAARPNLPMSTATASWTCSPTAGTSRWTGPGDRSVAFAPTRRSAQVVASQNSEIALGDFNGDIRLDIAMTTAQENRPYILLGNGDGTFSAPRTNTVATARRLPVVADFNADGKLDLGFINTGTGKVSVLPGKGDGDFLAAIDTTLGGTLSRMAPPT